METDSKVHVGTSSCVRSTSLPSAELWVCTDADGTVSRVSCQGATSTPASVTTRVLGAPSTEVPRHWASGGTRDLRPAPPVVTGDVFEAPLVRGRGVLTSNRVYHDSDPCRGARRPIRTTTVQDRRTPNPVGPSWVSSVERDSDSRRFARNRGLSWTLCVPVGGV